MRKYLQFLLIVTKFVKSIYTSQKKMWYVIDPIFAEKDTPQACLETYFRYFC